MLEYTLPDRDRDESDILRIQEEDEEGDVVVLVGRLIGTGMGWTLYALLGRVGG